MKSRMDKYYNDGSLQRTNRNDSLYEELYREKKEPTANVTVLDNVNEIDIAKIKEMVNSRENYKKVRQYENLMNKEDTILELSNENAIDTINSDDYDINQILEKKKSTTVEDNSKIRKISNAEYDALKRLALCIDNKTDFSIEKEEENLKTLINTIIQNKDLNDSDDLFANLKEDNIKEEKKDTTFYTNSNVFDKEDFDELDVEDKSTSTVLVVIAILAVLIATSVFVYFKFFK